MSEKPPYVCEAQDQSQGRPATFIFIHGYADDAEGLPLGLAQQFQFHNKLPYLRWLLPNGPLDPDVHERSWYQVKRLSSALKPRVPGHEDDPEEPDDENGILQTCARIDQLVEDEITRGVEPGRIVVGGFSQGCAVSLIWGLVGAQRDNVAGCFCASGYFPMADRISAIRKERGIVNDDKKKWLYIHGSKDILVPGRLFEAGKTELKKWIAEDSLEEHLYEGMGHSTCNAELRDLLIWLGKVIPP